MFKKFSLDRMYTYAIISSEKCDEYDDDNNTDCNNNNNNNNNNNFALEYAIRKS